MTPSQFYAAGVTAVSLTGVILSVVYWFILKNFRKNQQNKER